jgi:hypothetical protein
MSRIPMIEPATANGTAAGVLGQVRTGLGMVSAMTKAMAHSPAALKGYRRLNAVLSGVLRRQQAITGASRNDRLLNPTAWPYALSGQITAYPWEGLLIEDAAQPAAETEGFAA